MCLVRQSPGVPLISIAYPCVFTTVESGKTLLLQSAAGGMQEQSWLLLEADLQLGFVPQIRGAQESLW